MKNLEATEDRQQHPPTFAQNAVQALNPIAAFKSSAKTLSEKEVKSQFLRTTTRLADELRPLLNEAFELRNELDDIQEVLDYIQRLAVSEQGDLPRKDILVQIWEMLARNDDYVQYKSHKQLLGDLTKFYKDAGVVMQEVWTRKGKVLRRDNRDTDKSHRRTRGFIKLRQMLRPSVMSMRSLA